MVGIQREGLIPYEQDSREPAHWPSVKEGNLRLLLEETEV
jgi:hypothetical protein